MKAKLAGFVLMAAVAAATIFLCLPLSGQFPAESTIPKDKRRPRPIAKASTAAAPRTKDGKIELSGAWG